MVSFKLSVFPLRIHTTNFSFSLIFLILQSYTDSHGTWCCVCWKWHDWRQGIRSNRRDSCSSRGKSLPNKSEIFTVCPIVVYPIAAWFLGSFNHRPRPQHPDLRQRRSNTAGIVPFDFSIPIYISAFDDIAIVQLVFQEDILFIINNNFQFLTIL